ncbi:hypothetical protein WOLCODRAFT_135141 [Wolfiporia cocos MD-104 SS10]|uniref:Uncharacterized protein n=1 Tax=Wolfiporia cocos (strain MD-104) TaxID=742152 RepID=A0A2H3J9W3_WOLCO|nr:hypothetical protein WOLCODRAFT_135141 [Wolfiporia cocos MD-104 SS10]
MLKRQRQPSPFPASDAPMAPEPTLDIDYERVAKRRRQLAPPNHSGFSPGSEHERAESADEETDLEETEDRRRARWHADAGLYKAANTLLHDLHAEQRHRLVFSSSFSPPLATTGTAAHTREWPPHPQPLAHAPQHAPALATAPLDKNDLSCGDNGLLEEGSTGEEARRVAERYEDVNRLLGSCVRRRLGERQTQQNS